MGTARRSSCEVRPKNVARSLCFGSYGPFSFYICFDSFNCSIVALCSYPINAGKNQRVGSRSFRRKFISWYAYQYGLQACLVHRRRCKHTSRQVRRGNVCLKKSKINSIFMNCIRYQLSCTKSAMAFCSSQEWIKTAKLNPNECKGAHL